MPYNRRAFRFNSLQARRILEKESPLLDPYNGRIIEYGEPWEAEHIISLRSAWDWGAKDWTFCKLVKFANDPRNLITVGKSTNRSKGNRQLDEWVCLNLAYIPTRNQIVRDLADEYGLVIPDKVSKTMAFMDEIITKKHEHGIKMGSVRRWFIRMFGAMALPF